jgi:hypothetical protein
MSLSGGWARSAARAKRALLSGARASRAQSSARVLHRGDSSSSKSRPKEERRKRVTFRGEGGARVASCCPGARGTRAWRALRAPSSGWRRWRCEIKMKEKIKGSVCLLRVVRKTGSRRRVLLYIITIYGHWTVNACLIIARGRKCKGGRRREFMGSVRVLRRRGSRLSWGPRHVYARRFISRFVREAAGALTGSRYYSGLALLSRRFYSGSWRPSSPCWSFQQDINSPRASHVLRYVPGLLSVVTHMGESFQQFPQSLL